MVTLSTVLRKISFVRDHLERIKSQADCTLEEFLDDRDRQDIVCFNLMQAIQGCADLANHIVSSGSWGVPASYGETFDMLATKRVIPAEQAGVLRQVVAFRNLLAHDYAHVDFKEVHAS